MIYFYNILMGYLLLFFSPIWIPLVWFREKHRKPFLKRLFMESLPPLDEGNTQQGRRIWIHALSVGEVLSAEPLVKAMANRYGASTLVFTASTQTGFEMAVRVIRPHVGVLRYFPYDTLFSVKRALNVIEPHQVVIVETDIWPNFLMTLKRHRVPICLVNARLSDRSFSGYRHIRWLMGPLLSLFTPICTQTDLDLWRFRDLGVSTDTLVTTGNIKFDQKPINISIEEQHQLSSQLNIPAGVPIWVAGSTHDGEEEVLAAAYQTLRASTLKPVLIVAPRDPSRAGDVCRVFQSHGIGAVTMGEVEHQDQMASVVVIDRIGVLRPLYALADVAFVGGSLVPEGGHNPLEPASAAKPILFGPHTTDFRWICQMLEDEGGAIRVASSDQIAQVAGELIYNDKKNRQMGRRAYQVFLRNRGAVERIMKIIEPTTARIAGSLNSRPYAGKKKAPQCFNRNPSKAP